MSSQGNDLNYILVYCKEILILKCMQHQCRGSLSVTAFMLYVVLHKRSGPGVRVEESVLEGPHINLCYRKFKNSGKPSAPASCALRNSPTSYLELEL